MTNKNLAKRNVTLATEGDSPYMPNIGDEDIVPPEFRLMHPLSQAVQDEIVSSGQFYSPQTGDIYDNLEMVILRIQPTRTLWRTDELGAPRCSSNDRIHANPGGEFEGTLCAECSYRLDDVFSISDAEERREYCLPGYTILAINIESGLPFIYRAQGTSTRPIQNLITQVIGKYNRQPWRIVVSFGANRRKGKKGVYFILSTKKVRDLTDDEAEEYRAQADYWIGQPIDWNASQGDTSSGDTPSESEPRAKPATTPRMKRSVKDLDW